MASAGGCRCCPYGFHIDVGFVSFAEDIAKGNTLKRTPTLARRERTLMSPMDSLFSDSMENIMSDFEEVLGERPDKPKAEFVTMKNRMQNGYASDYTAYRSKPATTPTHVPSTNGNSRTFALDYNSAPPPKPPHRNPTTAAPIINGRITPTAFTALGRAVSEIKARNTESPFPGRDAQSRIGSRVGTPIDLGLPTQHQNGHAHTAQTNHRSHEHTVDRPYTLSVAPPVNGPSWRRQTADRTPINEKHEKTNGVPAASTPGGDFASLRRGREYAMSDSETSHRIRYYSASPKLPRKLQTAPETPSNFTYTHNNGHTVLAKTQGTCTSPIPERRIEVKIAPPVVETRAASTSTGPLPPAKPCSECPQLRSDLKETIARLPPPRPTVLSIATATDIEFRIPPEMIEIGVGDTVHSLSIGTDTEKPETVSRACSPIIIENHSVDQQTDEVSMASVEVSAVPSALSIHIQTDENKTATTHFGTNTEETETQEEKAAKEISEKETMTNRTYFRHFPSQTEDLMEEAVSEDSAVAMHSPSDQPSSSETASQTDYENDPSEPRVLADSDMAESLWLMPGKETAEVSVGTETEENIQMPPECASCLQREQTFGRNVGVGACSVTDKVCVTCDTSVDEVDENDAPGFKLVTDHVPSKQHMDKVAAMKKLLTTDQKQNFVRGTTISRSARIERKKGDDLEYIEHKNKSTTPEAASSTPTENTSEALKTKVVLKKEIPAPPSNVPEPVPARIPRPKISKYATPHESAETPDEADEAADRLTPLRSELRALGRWPRSAGPVTFVSSRIEECDSDGEDSDGSEGSYDINEEPAVSEGTPFEVTAPLREALETLNSSLLQPGSVTEENADWAQKYVQHEWVKTSTRKVSRAEHVEILLEQLKELGSALLKTVVNITDQNGNTALHYAVSHGNFSVVSCLLDSGECQLNLSNRAGYTAVMLAALSGLEEDAEKAVVQRLFEMGDVNARASQHGQTALMLAVSHGKKNATELLLQCGADVNLQDEEGSTALMCAAEHGHKELVKLLLAQDHVDAALTDCDSSTALSIAVENGHRDIGVLIYGFLNYTRTDSFDETL